MTSLTGLGLSIVFTILMLGSHIVAKQNDSISKKQYVLDQYRDDNNGNYVPNYNVPDYNVPNYNAPNYNTMNTNYGGIGAPSPSGGPSPPLDMPEEDTNVLDRIIKINDQNGMFNVGHQNDGGGPPVPDLFEGDIERTPQLELAVKEMKQLTKDNLEAFDAINGGQWPNAIVPYTFAYGFRGQSVVHQAIADFKKYTCIQFRPRRQSDRNYVQFMHGGGCSSMIGRQGGRQQISLASGCLIKGIAIHEMMHALGFFHEQSRRDRDKYITLHWGNINRGMQYNFQMYKAGHASTLGEKYDKKSVMHYGNYAFSINGRKTITSKSSYNEVLGQRSGMSETDIRQLNKYYNCGDTTKPTLPPPGSKLKDKFPFCVDVEKWCVNNDFVRQNCLKTCCKDRNTHCSYWSGKGHCNDKWEDWMKKTCPESCGYC